LITKLLLQCGLHHLGRVWGELQIRTSQHQRQAQGWPKFKISDAKIRTGPKVGGSYPYMRPPNPESFSPNFGPQQKVIGLVPSMVGSRGWQRFSANRFCWLCDVCHEGPYLGTASSEPGEAVCTVLICMGGIVQHILYSTRTVDPCHPAAGNCKLRGNKRGAGGRA